MCVYNLAVKVPVIMDIFAKQHTHATILQPSWILPGSTWVSQHQKVKTMKVKPIWIYWSKR